MTGVRRLFVILFACLIVEMNVTAQSDITLPQYQGYISVAPDGRYFVDEQGQGFIVIGENDGVPWAGLGTLINRLSPEATEAYISDLRAHGVTVSRIMIEYSENPYTYLEDPVGTFSDSMIQFWDDFIALAEKHDLYLLLTPYDTFWQGKNWGRYPYNAALGGPCATTRDWLTAPDCIAAQKNRWHFIIERWGGSPNIFAWDVMNEIDIWWNASAAEIDAYVTDMSAYIRQLETEMWGRTHMISASSAAPVPTGALGSVIYRSPSLDFANTHLYIGNEIKNPADPIGAGSMMAGGVVQSLAEIRDGRPYFDSESGPIDDWIENPSFDQEYHHNMSWGHLAAGGAGSGMRWPYTNPHWILPELRDNLLGLARFASTIDWAHFDSRSIVFDVRISQRNILKAGCSDGQTAIIWLLLDTRRDQSVSFEDVSVTVSDVLADGAYRIEFWETYQGNILTTAEAQVNDGALTFEIPHFDESLKDIAVLIRPQEG